MGQKIAVGLSIDNSFAFSIPIDSKIEVKSERDIWQKTGNIAIEYECYGKPSGISSTEADYWFHNLCIGEDTFATLVFKTDNLKSIIK